MSTTSQPDAQKSSFLGLAIAFELTLAVVGWLVAWLGGVPLASLMRPREDLAAALGWGAAATLPLLVMLVATLLCQWRPIAWLRRLVGRFVRLVFGQARWWQFAAVSIAAGVGEEVLFRGAIQPVAIAYAGHLFDPTIGMVLGLVIASLLFGMVHAASWSYFWLATLVGLYFGSLSLWREEILSAMIAHAAYDFLALTAISRGWFVRHRPLFSLPRRSDSSAR
ncbi:CPBP family intramembrane metalloprotease [Aeoliella sp. ICT_H6.2]|uniref:CPBP family intramembrane metalloprotease n=1 Tax=Aeoliella straminimaris TaxID=2954799 RepID=A0A9X2JIJ8_9BACT|nr:CPBP family intramembrane glutamic endopeptidase [Aeoliella straminimaris]MCO6046916.1 CPBP family intramembrane metalloprotease [Aeoliella straminimaris]